VPSLESIEGGFGIMFNRLGFTELFKFVDNVFVCLCRPRRPVEFTGDTRLPLSLFRCKTGMFLEFDRSRGRLGGDGSAFF